MTSWFPFSGHHGRVHPHQELPPPAGPEPGAGRGGRQGRVPAQGVRDRHPGRVARRQGRVHGGRGTPHLLPLQAERLQVQDS